MLVECQVSALEKVWTFSAGLETCKPSRLGPILTPVCAVLCWKEVQGGTWVVLQPHKHLRGGKKKRDNLQVHKKCLKKKPNKLFFIFRRVRQD